MRPWHGRAVGETAAGAHNRAMDAYEPFVTLGIALAAGLLVGLERERASDADARSPDASNFLGGLRTFPLFALLGALSHLLSASVGLALPIACFAALALLVGVSYADDVRKGRDRGLTTEVAILVTFLLGVLAADRTLVVPTERRVMVVAAIAVAVTFLLSIKQRVRALLDAVTTDDLYATIKFLVVAVLVLPLLPNASWGPFGGVNPFHVGLMVVLIAGLGMIGYVAVRVLGANRGLAITAIAGGLVSSTAVTLAMAARGRKDEKLADAAAGAIVLASSIMAFRVLLEVAAVHRPLVAPIALPIGLMGVTGIVVAIVLAKGFRGQRMEEGVQVGNPFELGSAVKFALLYAAVSILSRVAQEYLGDEGMYLAALLAGTTDVDAITLSTAQLAKDGLPTPVAVTTILLGAGANTCVKAGLAFFLGGGKLGRRAAIGFGAMLLAGGLGLVVTWIRG